MDKNRGVILLYGYKNVLFGFIICFMNKTVAVEAVVESTVSTQTLTVEPYSYSLRHPRPYEIQKCGWRQPAPELRGWM